MARRRTGRVERRRQSQTNSGEFAPPSPASPARGFFQARAGSQDIAHKSFERFAIAVIFKRQQRRLGEVAVKTQYAAAFEEISGVEPARSEFDPMPVKIEIVDHFRVKLGNQMFAVNADNARRNVTGSDASADFWSGAG